MDRGGWWATVHGVAKSWTRLSNFTSLSTCRTWTIKKAEHQRTDARLLRVSWTVRISNQSIHKEISPEYSLEGMMLKLKVKVKSLSRVRLFETPWTAACQASLSIINSRSLLKLISIESVMPSNHLILCHHIPFSSHLQSFPASRSFLVSQFFASGRQSIGVSASASVLPGSIQD